MRRPDLQNIGGFLPKTYWDFRRSFGINKTSRSLKSAEQFIIYVNAAQ
jgi:hypothetical protein